jgi:hypothetical protein
MSAVILGEFYETLDDDTADNVDVSAATACIFTGNASTIGRPPPS